MKILAILLIALSSLHAVAALFEVGPKKAHENIGDVAWESLQAGDTVLIYHRSQPYHEKWVICRQGTEQNKIVIRGVPYSFGRLPVISGSNASTRIQLDYWNENRSIIKIGGASIPPDTMPQHITIENLDIRSGRPLRHISMIKVPRIVISKMRPQSLWKKANISRSVTVHSMIAETVCSRPGSPQVSVSMLELLRPWRCCTIMT